MKLKGCYKKIMMMLAFILAICMTGMAGCDKDTDIEKEHSETLEQGIQIGFSFDSFVLERWIKDRDIFVSTCVGLGADVNVQNANGDLATQIEQIKYFIKKKVDVIVIVAVDSNGLSDVVKEAKNNGIKIIAYDRLIYNADIDLYISFDNEKVGKYMAEALYKKTGAGGKYIMLCGPKTDDNVEKVVKGFNEEISDRDITIVSSMNAENWRAERVYEYLEQHPDVTKNIDGIMCGNDNLASQAVRYLAERGIAGSIPIVGQDADLDACQRIVEGTQLMTVYKPVEQLAATAAKYAVFIAGGEKFDIGELIKEKKVKQGRLKNNEMVEQYISIEPYAVDADNMDEVIIEGGFHLAEEVYLNVK